MASPKSEAILAPAFHAAFGRGAAAGCAIRPGETVLAVPASQILTSTKCSRLLAPFLKGKLRDLLQYDDICMALVLLLLGRGCTDCSVHGDGTSASEAAKLCSLSRHWRSYTLTLPVLDDLNCLASEWDYEQLDALADPSMAAQARSRRAELRQVYEQIQATLAVAAPATSASTPATTAETAIAASLRRVLSWPSFRWALACVTSRSFLADLEEGPKDSLYDSLKGEQADIGSNGTGAAPGRLGAEQGGFGFGSGLGGLMPPLAMVPTVDMLNHEGCEDSEGNDDSDSGTVSNTEAGAGSLSQPRSRVALDTVWSSRGLTLKARRAYAVGEPLHLSYGSRNGRDLLENYGFILPLGSNSSETAALELPMWLWEGGAGAGPGASASPQGQASSKRVSASASPAFWPRHLAASGTTAAAVRGRVLEDYGPVECLELPAGPMARVLPLVMPGVHTAVAAVAVPTVRKATKQKYHPGCGTDVLRLLRMLVLQDGHVAELTGGQADGRETIAAHGTKSTTTATGSDTDRPRVLYSADGTAVTILSAPAPSPARSRVPRIPSSRFDRPISDDNEARAAALLLDLVAEACGHMQRTLGLPESSTPVDAVTIASATDGRASPTDLSTRAHALCAALVLVYVAASARLDGTQASIATQAAACATCARPVFDGSMSQGAGHQAPSSAAEAAMQWAGIVGRDDDSLAQWERTYQSRARPARAAASATYVVNRAACLLGAAAHVAACWAGPMTGRAGAAAPAVATDAGGEAAAQAALDLNRPADILPILEAAVQTARLAMPYALPAETSIVQVARPGTDQSPSVAVHRQLRDILQGVRYALECQQPWAELLLSGRKTIETRQYALPQLLWGVPIAILQSPSPGGLARHGLGSGALVGILCFCGQKEYRSKAQWDGDTAAHCVPIDAPPPSQGGFGWEQSAVVDVGSGQASMTAANGKPPVGRYGWVVAAYSAVRLPVAVALAGLAEGHRVHRSVFALGAGPSVIAAAAHKSGDYAGADMLERALWSAAQSNGQAVGPRSHGEDGTAGLDATTAAPANTQACVQAPYPFKQETYEFRAGQGLAWGPGALASGPSGPSALVQAAVTAPAPPQPPGRVIPLTVQLRSLAWEADKRGTDLTGAYAWPASMALSQLLCSYPMAAYVGRSVCELGCGAALPSAVCAGLGWWAPNEPAAGSSQPCASATSSSEPSEAGTSITASIPRAAVVVATDGQADVLELARRNISGATATATATVAATTTATAAATMSTAAGPAAARAGLACTALALPLSWRARPDDTSASELTFEEQRLLAALAAARPPTTRPQLATTPPDAVVAQTASAAAPAQPRFDLIVAADVIYVHRSAQATDDGWGVAQQARALMACAKRLLNDRGIFLMAYMPRYRSMGPPIRAAAEAAGLGFRPLARNAVLSTEQKASGMFTDVRIAAVGHDMATVEAFCRACSNDDGNGRDSSGLDPSTGTGTAGTTAAVGLPQAEPYEETDGAGWDDDEAWAAHPLAGLQV